MTDGEIEKLIAGLGDLNMTVQDRFASALSLIGEPAIVPLFTALKDGSREFFLRQGAAFAMVMIGEATLEKFIEALAEEDPATRQLASWALGKLRNPKGVEPLISVITDNKPKKPGFVLLFGKQELFYESQVKVHAASALGEIGDFRAVGPLTAALEAEDEDLRKEAATALKNITR